MTLTLHLSPEIEAKLREESARSGKNPDLVVLEALQEKLALTSEKGNTHAPSSQLTAFRDWLTSRPAANPHADLSRDMIYGNRGE